MRRQEQERVIYVDGQPIEAESGETVSDLKYKAGVPDDDILYGMINGELTALNDHDSVDLLDDNEELTTNPGPEGDVYG